MKHRDMDDSKRYKVLSKELISKYGIDTSNYDVIKGWIPNNHITKEFVRDNLELDALNKLLSSNTNFETEEFLNLMQETMNENSGQDELEKFKKEFVDIKSKKSKLIDLMVEDKISENDYNEKVEKYNRKLEILENKIEQLKLLAEDKKSMKFLMLL